MAKGPKLTGLSSGGISSLYKNDAPQTEIDLDRIDDNPLQPRKTINKATIESLANSIDSSADLLQPIVVRPHGAEGDRYILVAGQRRILAYRHLGRSSIPSYVVELDEETAALASLFENDEREELEPVDRANYYQALLDKFEWSQKELAEKIGVAETTVSKVIGLLNLPSFLADAYQEGIVDSPAAISELRKAHHIDPERVEKHVAGAEKISVTEATDLYKQVKSKSNGDSKTKTTLPASGGGLDKVLGQDNDDSGTEPVQGSRPGDPVPVDMVVSDAVAKAQSNQPLPHSWARKRSLILEALQAHGKLDKETLADVVAFALKDD